MKKIEELECFLLLQSTFSDIFIENFKYQKNIHGNTHLRQNTNSWKQSPNVPMKRYSENI